MKNKILVIDSGVGGLTVLKELLKMNPNREYIYFGDTKNCPYGEKKKEEIVEYVLNILKIVPINEVGAIIIACNTASIFATKIIKKTYNIPVYTIFDMALEEFRGKRNENILVLATNLTIKSGAFQDEIKKITTNSFIDGKSCPSFVPFIETNDFFNLNKRNEVIKEELSEVNSKKYSSVLLGCTHFPFLEKELKIWLSDNVKIINPAKKLAKEFTKNFTNEEISNTKKNNCIFYISGEKDNFEKISNYYLKTKINIQEIPWNEESKKIIINNY